MSNSIIILNGILTMPNSCFSCPKCDFNIESRDYHHRLERTPQINAKCPNCNAKLILIPNYKNGISAYIKQNKNTLTKL